MFIAIKFEIKNHKSSKVRILSFKMGQIFRFSILSCSVPISLLVEHDIRYRTPNCIIYLQIILENVEMNSLFKVIWQLVRIFRPTSNKYNHNIQELQLLSSRKSNVFFEIIKKPIKIQSTRYFIRFLTKHDVSLQLWPFNLILNR